MLLVFGSINVDLLFQVETLPRPGETVLGRGYELAPGGKGANQAAAAAKSGAQVAFVGAVGDDEFGRFALEALRRSGADVGHLQTSGARTGVAVIAIDRQGENQITVGSGANLEVRAEQVGDDLLAGTSTVLCQNELRPEETFALIRRAKAAGCRTILNLAPAGEVPGAVLYDLDVLVVNEVEAAAAAGVSTRSDPADLARSLARSLARKHDLACVVTLGAAGAIAMTPGGGHRVETLAIQAVDTTGAGDAFVGVLAAALDQGHTLERALCRASVAAGLACLQIGAQSSQPSASAIEAGLADLADVAPFA